jgi:hypothetical protein
VPLFFSNGFFSEWMNNISMLYDRKEGNVLEEEAGA